MFYSNLKCRSVLWMKIATAIPLLLLSPETTWIPAETEWRPLTPRPASTGSTCQQQWIFTFLLTSCEGTQLSLGPKKQDLWPKTNERTWETIVVCEFNFLVTVCQKLAKNQSGLKIELKKYVLCQKIHFYNLILTL